MLHYIKGKFTMRIEGGVVVEAGGLGYEVAVPDNSAVYLAQEGEAVTLYLYMAVREDDVSLYGFCTNEELKMFEQLIGVSGVGAKSALTILANISPSSFALAIISGDVKTLKELPGIGAKSAQRMILELKDKMKTQDAIEEDIVLAKPEVKDSKARDAIDALQVLGYARKDIEAVISRINTDDLSVEEIIKQGLKYLGM